MGRSDTFEGIDNHRRRFFGAAALAIAAAQLRLIGPANAQVKAKWLPPIKPGTTKSFASLKQIDAGALNEGGAGSCHCRARLRRRK